MWNFHRYRLPWHESDSYKISHACSVCNEYKESTLTFHNKVIMTVSHFVSVTLLISATRPFGLLLYSK